MRSPLKRAVLLSTVSMLGLAVPASAGVAGEARVSGQYRVVYVKTAGVATGASGTYVWSVVPRCAAGACSIRVRSRKAGEKSGYPLPFDFDGTTYQNARTLPAVSPCVLDDGTVLAAKDAE